jgi:phosphoribosyl 1,2-cyclic phosphate phosphodiesterase
VRVTVLGSGTSFGVPMIGCRCAVCNSPDPLNQRTRASVHIQIRDDLAFLVDTSVDLREQALANDIRRVDAVFFTHTHSDHVNGLDDLRSFNWMQRSPIACYSRQDVLDDIAVRFAHCFRPAQEGAGIPQITMHGVDGPFEVGGVRVTPIPVKHGILDIVGWRFDDFGYVTDASVIPDASMKLLEGVEVLIVNALRHTPHPTHMSLSQALDVVQRIGPRQAYFTHICHDLDHAETNSGLPSNAQLAFDGLKFDV